jgi:hypothetical protein
MWKYIKEEKGRITVRRDREMRVVIVGGGHHKEEQ